MPIFLQTTFLSIFIAYSNHEHYLSPLWHCRSTTGVFTFLTARDLDNEAWCYGHICYRNIPPFTRVYRQGRAGGGLGGAEALPDFKLMLLCVQLLLQKDVQNLSLDTNKRGKKQLSGYKHCYTYKNQSLEVSKYMNLALVYVQQTRSYWISPPLLKCCLRPCYNYHFS